MVSKGGILLVALFILVMATPAMLGVAQPSEEEAKANFEALGCTGCHNGGVAPTWDQVVALFQEWKTKYGSLDEAVANEVSFFGKKFNTYDEMMAEMAKSSAAVTPDNPDFQVIDQYLRSIFEGQPAGGGEETQAPEQPQETQETQPQEEQPQETQAPEQPAEAGGEQEEQPAEEATKGPTLGFGAIVGIAVVILVIIVGLAYFIARK